VVPELPVGNDPFSFVSAQQVGIARLSSDYCDTMVETPALRNAIFPGFDFTATADVAFNTQAKRDLIINPLVDKMLGTGLNNQPGQADVRPVLNTLFDQLTAGCTAATCPAGTTRNIVKGVCSAVLSSGALLIHRHFGVPDSRGHWDEDSQTPRLTAVPVRSPAAGDSPAAARPGLRRGPRSGHGALPARHVRRAHGQRPDFRVLGARGRGPGAVHRARPGGRRE